MTILFNKINDNESIKDEIIVLIFKFICNYLESRKNYLKEIPWVELTNIKKILLIENRAGTIWNKLIKTELFDNIRFESRSANDVVVTYKIVLKAEKIVYSNQIKYYYLKHDDSILGSKDPNHSIDIYKAMEERYIFLKKIHNRLQYFLLMQVFLSSLLFYNEL